MTRTWDVVIVGGGATGGWAAKRLTEAGLEVLLLEAGPQLDAKKEFQRLLGHDESARAVDGAAAVAPDSRQPIQRQCYAYSAKTRHLFVDDVDCPYSTPEDRPFSWIRMRLVGGRTALWNRIALRMSDWQFKAASLDGCGEDWPLSYANLAPFYDEVEQFVRVYGELEDHPEVPDGSFVSPPPLTGFEAEFRARLTARAPVRPALRLRQTTITQPGVDISSAEAVPYYCSAASTISAAKETGRLTLRGDAVVSRVLTDRAGSRARGVVFVDAGSMEEHEVVGDVVILCASTLESTRILLNSSSARYPTGLGNASGVLGRYLMDHTCGISIRARKARPDPEREESLGLYVPFARRKDQPFLRGYGIQFQPFPDELHLFALGEMLPREDNLVSLNESLKDKWGIPCLRIECSHGPNEYAMAEEQAADLVALAEIAGCEIIDQSIRLFPPGSAIHEAGTARMGAERKTSFLNGFNQSWEIPNLFVTDGACFTSIGFQNPTLTMMAITARACSHIVEHKRGAGL